MPIRTLTEQDGDNALSVVTISVLICAPIGLFIGIYRWWNFIPENTPPDHFINTVFGMAILGVIVGIGVGLVAFAILFILGGIIQRLPKAKSIRNFFSPYSTEKKMASELIVALKILDQYDNAKSDKKSEKIGQLRECLERTYEIYDPSFEAVRSHNR